MKSSQSVVLGLAVLTLGGGLALGLLPAQLRPAAAQAKADSTLRETSGYRKWKRANEKPLLLPAPLDALCRPATLKDLPQTSVNPHRKKWFTVYVNGAAQRAMFKEQKPQFPVGSVILKEKHPDKDGKKLELMTVMIKRGKGFNAEHGDWEYAVLDGPTSKVEERGKLENCQSCHELVKSTDYVFRTYLAKEKPKPIS